MFGPARVSLVLLILASACHGNEGAAASDVPADARPATPDTGGPSDTGTDARAGTDATPIAADATDDAEPVADATVPDVASPPPACPRYTTGVAVGTIRGVDLLEVSGIVESRREKGRFWIHDDHGAGARLFVVGRDGALVATFTVAGAQAQDWEDIAIGPGPSAGTPYLYVGDIGDNDEARAAVQLYRAAEPAPSAPSPTQPVPLTGVDRISLVYPDGPHNAETLLVDPLTSDVFIVTKSSKGDSRVYRAPAPLAAGTTVTLEDTGVRLRFGVAPLGGDPKATGGDISSSGDKIVVRTYSDAYLWRRSPGQTVAQALAGEACHIPQHTEPQGEAFAFAADESGYYTTSEGKAQPLYWFAAAPPP
jgi:hypothetical protein